VRALRVGGAVQSTPVATFEQQCDAVPAVVCCLLRAVLESPIEKG